MSDAELRSTLAKQKKCWKMNSSLSNYDYQLGEENGAEETLAEVNMGSLVIDKDSPIEELHIWVDNVENEDNAELRESFTNTKEVSDEPVPCMDCLVGVGWKENRRGN